MKIHSRIEQVIPQRITIPLDDPYPGLTPLGEVVEQALRVMWGRQPETFSWHYEFLADRALRAVCEAILRDGPPEFPLNLALELPRDREHHRVADPSKVIFVNLCRG